jgi:hypothetical protein
VKKIGVTPLPFHHARPVTQISHLLNRAKKNCNTLTPKSLFAKQCLLTHVAHQPVSGKMGKNPHKPGSLANVRVRKFMH